MNEISAIIASIILFNLSIFQLLLILGFPLGKFAWGGKHVILPKKLRISSGFSIAIYYFFILVLLNQGDVISLFSKSGWINTAHVVITIYSFIGIPLNAISRSKPERIVMTPIATLLSLLSLLILVN